jgi:hypothetical protein
MKRFALFSLLAVFSCAQAQWTYRTTRDEMRGSTIRFASLSSANKVHLETAQPQQAVLRVLLRKRGDEDTEVLMVIDNAQLPCQPECEFAAKFDDGAVEDWPASPPERGRSDMITVHHSEAMLRLLRAARKVVVEVGVSGVGRAQFTFNPRGLKWE